MTHRDAAQLCVITAPSEAFALEHLDRIVQPLRDFGLSDAIGLSYQPSVISPTLGWALFEQRELTRAFLSQALNFDESLMNGLDALVAGLPRPPVAARRVPV